MHDNKSQWFIQVFCGVLTAFALFIPMPAMVFAEDEQQEYVQESGQDVPESELSEKVGEIHTEDYTEGWVLIDDKTIKLVRVCMKNHFCNCTFHKL